MERIESVWIRKRKRPRVGLALTNANKSDAAITKLLPNDINYGKTASIRNAYAELRARPIPTSKTINVEKMRLYFFDFSN